MHKRITLLSAMLGIAVMHMTMTDEVSAAAAPVDTTPVADAAPVLTEKQASLLARFEAAIVSGVKDVEEYFETGILHIEAFISDSKSASVGDSTPSEDPAPVAALADTTTADTTQVAPPDVPEPVSPPTGE